MSAVATMLWRDLEGESINVRELANILGQARPSASLELVHHRDTPTQASYLNVSDDKPLAELLVRLRAAGADCIGEGVLS